ncbi:NADH-ubiquinone oxidoreductase 21.3 kDa subunit [Lachnellula occidentalis]|uniref:NADH-ubiquinone oxidoreductase 21.3 kDa subunit n=1 Tax=Lachnellula occidentalis TaxID=215460 RepID=A0A8H8S8W4_9HELO|nr:NADH-ubiquinone oxidoreductase 21.3 kDa subunit [Lachnellula occidentalis]
MASGHDQYHPKDAIKEAVTASMITGSAGAFISAVQNTLTKRNHGPWGVFTRTGSTIAVFTIMGGAYEFTKNAAANLREKDDSWNPALGGLLAGAVMGLKRGTTPSVMGFGAMTAVIMGTYDYTGAALTGYKKDKEVDEFERKQFLRKNRRVPIEQTVGELGEGRGIYPPGYDERRKERIKENYGIDVPAKSTHS